MENKLIMLYNTMGTISTNGEDTLKMADCLRFLNEMIKEVHDNSNQKKDTSANENKEV